ncbi:polyprenyl glycosylphosphotransferase [Gemmatimonadetes bacterium T265]|nr:polyprenyl glycosylphosphotransferase [Gemmatimonadetes bacterium T265]
MSSLAPALPRAADARVFPQGAGARTPTLPYPVLLQMRARAAMRKHMLRAAARRAGLLAADLAALAALRFALGELREGGLLGTGIQEVARLLLPKGSLYPYEFTAALVLGLWAVGAYTGGKGRKSGRAVVVGTALGVALISWDRFWASVTLHGAASAFSIYSALSFVLCACAVSAVLLVERLLVDRCVGWLRAMPVSTVRVLAVGPAEDCRRALRGHVDQERACTIVGYVHTDAEPDADAAGGVPDLVRILFAQRVDAVLLCGDIGVGTMGDVVGLADSAGCRVLAMRRLSGTAGLQAAHATIGGLPVVQLTRPTLRGGQLAAKRAFDLALATAGLVALSPALLALAALVRATSRGPAVYRQVRVGEGGRPFKMYKFRSMVADADARRAALDAQNIYGDGRLFKVKNDPRVTPLGRVLRATSLDELPQLWNVVRGDMSLVGPRPPMFTELAVYDDHDYVRFDMKPGVTGPWQVAGRNAITDFDEVVRLETEYMRGWTLWRDVGILARTVPAVFGRAGAL